MKVLVYHAKAEKYRQMIEQRFPGIEVIAEYDSERVRSNIADSEILIAWRFPIDMLAAARKLRWIQLTSAGVEQLLPAHSLLKNVSVTNARGIHSDIMTDYAFCAMLMLHWNIQRVFSQQKFKIWSTYATQPLCGKTLGIIGVGTIGKEIARRAKVFRMKVLGIKRTPAPVRGADHIFGPNQLIEVLAVSDFVVILLPATNETRGLIGRRELSSMKKTAYLINISRGSVVEESAMIFALKEGWIAGAALDVFEQEPLPKQHALWGLENVIITPHIAGELEDYPYRVMEIFAENLIRFQKGHPLRNKVDLARGY